MLEQKPVLNHSSQEFSPIGEERPKTPPTPGGAGEKDADAMEVDGKAPPAPADSPGVPPADIFGVPPADIFGDSDDEDDARQAPPTWAGGCLSPKTCAKEHNTDPTQDKQPCRLMPKNYKKKPPMHSGSVYNAAELVRSTSTYTARNQSHPGNFTTPEKPPAGIDSLINKETPLPSFLKQALSDCDDVDTN